MENYGGISLEAYAKADNGFNSADANDVAELNKALEAGDQKGGAVDGSLTASGAPLKVESLEKNLKVITFSQKNIVLWKQTPVLPAYNTVEEYNRLVSYGSDQGGFNNEGELPEEDDSIYQRNSQLVKYIGNTRMVTHPMTLVNTAHGAVIEREINNGTTWILAKIERALVEANASIIPQEFNGIYKQLMDDFSSELEYLDSDNVIDMRGYRLDEESLEQASNTIIENFGFPTDIFWSPRAGSDYAKNFYPRQRTMTPVGEGGKTGSNVTSFVSQAGTIPFNPSVFMKPKVEKTSATSATSSKAPLAPTKDGSAPVTPIAATVADNKFGSGDAGTYLYATSSLNRYGESALTILNTSPATIVAGGACDLKFTETAGSQAASGFRIYRSVKGATYSAGVTKFYPLFDISKAQLTAGYNGTTAGLVRDLNRYLAGCSSAFMIQRDLDVYAFKQLAPLMKMDLALLSPAYRFMILLYGTPIIYAPRKVVRFINIGSTANATTNALIA